jgi:hypothetical protein
MAAGQQATAGIGGQRSLKFEHAGGGECASLAGLAEAEILQLRPTTLSPMPMMAAMGLRCITSAEPVDAARIVAQEFS